MKKIICVLLLSVFLMPVKLSSGTLEREKLDTISAKLSKMKYCYDLYVAGKITTTDSHEFILTADQKVELVNKYNTLKAEVKKLVNGL